MKPVDPVRYPFGFFVELYQAIKTAPFVATNLIFAFTTYLVIYFTHGSIFTGMLLFVSTVLILIAQIDGQLQDTHKVILGYSVGADVVIMGSCIFFPEIQVMVACIHAGITLFFFLTELYNSSKK